MQTKNQKVLCIRLKQLRQQACVSVSKISHKTGITTEHIRALENCNYDELPQGSARKTIVKQYAQCIGINPKTLEKHFDELKCEHKQPPTKAKYMSRGLPATIRALAATCAVIALVGYLGLEVHAMIGPPDLTIENPVTNLETHISSIDITGTTAPESHVTINGLKTNLDTTGHFSETLHLKEGLNEIIIISEAKRGGIASTSRTVLYSPDTTKAAITELDPQL